MKKFGTNIERVISANLGETWKNELDDLLISLDALIQGNFMGFVNAPGDLVLAEDSPINQVWIVNFIGVPTDNNPFEPYHGYIVRYDGLGEFTYIQPKNGWKMYNTIDNVEYIYTYYGNGLSVGPWWINSFDYYSRYVELLQNALPLSTDKVVVTDAYSVSKSVLLSDLIDFFNNNSLYDDAAFVALQNQVNNLVNGFACVTNVTPIGTENVTITSTDSDGLVVNAINVSSLTFNVQVFAVTGIQKLKPLVKIVYPGSPVDGDSISLVQSTTKNTWTGTIQITMLNAGDFQIIHEDGYIDTCKVTYVAKPVVTNIQFTNSTYPLAPTQTEYPAGRSVSVTVTTNIPIDYIDIIGDGTTASIASTTSVAQGTTAVFDITTTNHTNSNNYPIKLRVRTPNVGLQSGTFSNIYTSTTFDGAGDHVRTIKINNTLPTIFFGTITYDTGFKALKLTEGATVVMTTTNITLPFDTVSVTSNGELTVTNGTLLGNKIVNRAGGGYNISSPNLFGTVYKSSNDTSATASTVVKIAHTPQLLTVRIPKSGAINYTRLRSGGSYGSSIPSYPVTIESTQELLNDVGYKPTITPSAGSFDVAPFVSDSINKIWTRQLLINDAVPKGAASFSDLSTYNLAGIQVTTAPNLTYVIGGFVERVITFSRYLSPTFNREAPIGTQVIDVSKLKATNLSMSSSHTHDVTYNPLVIDDPEVGPFTYSITNNDQTSAIPGTYVYNNNSNNAAGNNAVDSNNWAKFEIEETE